MFEKLKKALEKGLFYIDNRLKLEFQASARFELNDFLSGDGDSLVGFGVVAFSLSALFHFESTETYQRKFATFFQGLARSAHESVESVFSLNFCQTGFFSHCID